MQRYIDQLLADMTQLRLQRVEELHRLGKFEVQCIMTGYNLEDPATPIVWEREEDEEEEEDDEDELQLPTPPPAESLEEDAATDIDREVQTVLANLRGDDPVDPTASFASRIGLDLSQFPPAERLDDQQLEALTMALRPLMSAFGRHYGGPNDYPPRLLYPVLLESLRRPGGPMAGSLLAFDGCTGNPVGCRWGRWCTCLAYRTKAEFIADGGDPTDIPDERFQDPDAASGFDWRSV